MHILDALEDLEEQYKKNKDADFHKIVADMAKIPRKTAKTINLGLFYGMGRTKLQKELKLSKEEARDLFNNYHEKVPFVRKLSQTLTKFAEEHRLIFTLEDRFCHFNKWEPIDKQWNDEEGKFEISEHEKNEETGRWEMKYYPVPILSTKDARTRFKSQQTPEEKKEDPFGENFYQKYKPAFTYKTLNKLVQGSAADMTKKAMVNLYEKGILPHIQIHDELCISIKNKEEGNTIKTIMEKAIPLEIPNKVDYESGDNWGTIK